ncbi:hypothetical protein NDU88_003646 [Pleurodeles waltl]|uniref:Uncharacterized protein n=1 Tax=Pleurodeles waltl TaxID=8319 RepID=A0AAV7V305_PLEWA|nr:hypothetical protein NDU88_003646 [Pleurodeles waltl]
MKGPPLLHLCRCGAPPPNSLRAWAHHRDSSCPSAVLRLLANPCRLEVLLPLTGPSAAIPLLRVSGEGS